MVHYYKTTSPKYIHLRDTADTKWCTHMFELSLPVSELCQTNSWETSQHLNPARPCVHLQSHIAGWDGFLLRTDILAWTAEECGLHLDTRLNCGQQAYISPPSWRGKECLQRARRDSTKQRAKDGGASHCHSWIHPSLFSRALGFICPPECLLMHDHKASSYQSLIASKWVNRFRWRKSYTRTGCTFTSLLHVLSSVWNSWFRLEPEAEHKNLFKI